MPAGTRRRSPTWQQSLLLVIFGSVVGVPSCVGASHGMFGGTVSQYWVLYVAGSLAGAMAFISGFARFLAISVKAVTSPTGSARSPTWQQSLLLVIFGVVVGFPSCVGASHGMFGGTVSRYWDLYVAGFLAGTVAFISGFASFLAISVKAVTSPAGSASAIAAPSRASTGAISRVTPPQLLPDALVKRQASVQSSAAAALIRLRITLVAVVTFACIVALRDWGWPPLTSSYGRYYWLNEVLTLLLGQLPFVLALIRTWKVPDRAGLALAIAAGATQILATFFADLRYTAANLDSWPWLSSSLGLAAVVFAYLAWRPFFSRKGDVGLLISIVFGFLAYTWLMQISLAILYSREQRWITY